MRQVILVFLLGFIFCSANAQQTVKATQYQSHKKGAFYALWGWNRDAFTKSTLHIKGADYDLVFKKITAHDRPTPISYHDYLKIDRITIPQTNVRFGYFIKDGLAVTLGIDHMKYVMDQNQTVITTGNITRPGAYKGNYSSNMMLTEDFFTFEHTDGLNLVNIGVEKYYKALNTSKRNFIVNALIGAEAGVMVPKTNARLLDYERNDRYHLSGFGASLKAGLEVVIFKRLLLKTEAKGGYINMPNIILHEKGIQGKGSQDFFFVQGNVMIGWYFSLGKRMNNTAVNTKK